MTKIDTLVNHVKHPQLLGSNRPLQAPIYQGVKYTTDTLDELKKIFVENSGRYVYSRHSNPTVRQLEELLASLQGCEDGICVGSGVAAISSVLLSLLKSGDHVIMFWESYKPTRYLVRELLAKFGISHSILSVTDIDKLESIIQPGKTKLVLFESPTNPITRLVDIEKITSVCRKHNVLSVLDNTFAGFHNHKQFDIDLYLHSLTKFANGHGDTMGGAILGNSELLTKMKHDVAELGPTMDPQSANLILRGMKTYPLRYKAASENALYLANWLSKHPKVNKLYYPALANHPDHNLYKKQMKNAGAVIAVDLKGPETNVEKFIDNLKLFQLSGSLGSTESLIAPIELFYGNDLSYEEKKTALITNDSVRLSVGIEGVEDLKADLEQALSALT